jgi:hypothetical protein
MKHLESDEFGLLGGVVSCAKTKEVWIISGLAFSDIPGGFEMSCSTPSMVSLGNFLYATRNDEIPARLNFSSGTLTANLFANRSTSASFL